MVANHCTEWSNIVPERGNVKAMYFVQGVWEKDEIRKDDSFRTFEEILALAREQKVCIKAHMSCLCLSTNWLYIPFVLL